MQHYVLRPNIPREIIEFLGLPYESLRKDGVFYITEENRTCTGDDNLEHYSVVVWLAYKSNGEIIDECWEKKYFDLFFIPG